MSRYDWPPPGRTAKGRQPYRTAWNLSREAGTNLTEVTAQPPVPPEPAARFRPALAPAGPAELWLPLGPTTTLDGTAQHNPRTAGRCRDIAVNPDDPARIYVASALGGLWYSENSGETWEQVGAFTTVADRTQLQPSSTSLSCGAVYVKWGASAADDEVWLGTGEPDSINQPYDRGYKGRFAGVGVLYALGPVTSVRTSPTADPWTRQAQPRPGYAGLRGASVWSFASDPADKRRIVAATTRGLHVHDPAAPAGTDPWSLVLVAKWDAAARSPGSANIMVTDVAWVPAGAGGRLWAAVRQAGTPLTGLWRSDAGTAGPFEEVPVDARTGAGEPDVNRIAIAAAPGHPDVLYVMASGEIAAPRLHRVDGPATAQLIIGRPGRPFFGDPKPGDPDQSGYDMAIAVDPDDPARFMIGGAFTRAASGMGAAVFRLTVGAAPVGGQWHTDYTGKQGDDKTWVGAGIHPDVHRIRWVKSGATVHVYVCNDGGVYHSARDVAHGGDRGTYVSRASGMSVTEEVFCTSHPDSDGVVLSGVQDNGVQLRIGDGVWRRAVTKGDGGGVAFDPNLHGRFIAQATRSFWVDDDDADSTLTPTRRVGDNTAFNTEHRASCFYSNPAVIDNGGVTQLAVGTTRVWYSEQWGRSFPDPFFPSLIRRQWAVLPGLTDPRAGDAPDTTTGKIPPGPLPAGTIDVKGTGVRVLRWAGVDRLYVLMPGSVHRFDRAAGVWHRTQIELRPTLPVGGVPPAVPPVAAGGPHLPPDGSLNDLAVHDQARGAAPDPHGSFYLATSHPQEPIWWFDGDHTFHPCGLGSAPPPPPPVAPGSPGGIKATGYAVLVDPDDPSVVYAGTALGVYRGTLTLGAGGPSWDWRDMNNGLPEAAVQDLTITSWGGGTLKLMRACLQSRGVWEVDLTAAAADLTYLRAHPYDTRRMVPSPMADPLHRADRLDREWPMDWAYRQNRDHRTLAGGPAPHPDGTARDTYLWHASPDIRVRPAPGAPPPAHPAAAPGPVLPWQSSGPPRLPADRFALWSVQTALHAIDPRFVPDGQWSPAFDDLLAEIRPTLAPPLSAASVVDTALWDHPAIQAGFWSDPWAAGGPAEADLVERVTGMRTPRPTAAAVSGASVALPAGPSRVEVCVHRRGPTAASAADVGVLLLRRQVVEPVADWGTIAVPAIPGLAAIDGLPAAGGTLPAGIVLPADWTVADTSVNVRRPGQDFRTAQPAVVSFAVDFTGLAGIWLLLALVRHGGASPVLAGAAHLSDLIPLSAHVAARTVELA